MADYSNLKDRTDLLFQLIDRYDVFDPVLKQLAISIKDELNSIFNLTDTPTAVAHLVPSGGAVLPYTPDTSSVQEVPSIPHKGRGRPKKVEKVYTDETRPTVDQYLVSIVERCAIFVRKELLCLPRQEWTKDPVYAKYKFCNAFRCLDATYKLLWDLGIKSAGLRAVLRFCASRPMLEHIKEKLRVQDKAWTDAWNKANRNLEENPDFQHGADDLIHLMLDAYMNEGINLVTGSFIVKRYGDDYNQLRSWYTGVNEIYKQMLDSPNKTTTEWMTQEIVRRVKQAGDFSAYCVVSDFIYLIPTKFDDLYTWTSWGPGAFRGINLLTGDRTTKTNYCQHIKSLVLDAWYKYAEEMKTELLKRVGLTEAQLNTLSRDKGYTAVTYLITHPTMLDAEHWLCEFQKYCRGYSRNVYVGGR